MPHGLAQPPRTGDGAFAARSGAWDPPVPGAAPSHTLPAATARTVAAGDPTRLFTEGFSSAEAPPPVGDDPSWPGDGLDSRFTARAAARGVLLALLAQAGAACVVLFVAIVRLVGSGHDALSLERGSMGPLLLAAGFGFATGGALIALQAAVNGRGHRLRHTTIVLAIALTTAWPLSGLAVPAAVLATLAIGLAAAFDALRPPQRAVPPLPAGALLAVVSVGLMASGLAGAQTRDRHPRPTPVPRDTPAHPRRHRAQHPPTRPHAAATATATSTAPAGGAPVPTAPAQPAGPSDREATPATATGPSSPSGSQPARPAGPSSPSGSQPAPAATPAPRPSTAHPSPGPALPDAAALPDGAALPDEPAATESPAGDAAAVVSAYYTALDARSFTTAWHKLSPAVQRAFGGFARWKAGFASTLASHPQAIVATALPGGAYAVRHVLVAHDRSACGGDPVERHWSVRWRLVRDASGAWTAASLHAAALGPWAMDPACR